MIHVIPDCNHMTLSELRGAENLNTWCVKAMPSEFPVKT